MEEPTKLTETEASGGSKPGVTRYVLPLSLAIVVIAFVALLLIYR